MKNLLAAATAAAALSTAAGSAHAAAPLWGFQISDASQPLVAGQIDSFLGPPDDDFTGIGGGYITYDFGQYRLVDGAGQDLNVYEYNAQAVEFSSLDVLVSGDGLTFFNIDASAAPAIDLDGDEAHGNAAFRMSYDLGAAVAGLGVSEFRYLRLSGTATGTIGGTRGFDVDAVAAINYVDKGVTGAIPEPATWAMMILGFGAAGSILRRRRAMSPA